ncbi:MAG: diaminopimelate epimerase [Bacteroidetes bacterium]|nr:diaminopimelate epimerase [Bacteroidota bacterium]
MKIPFTKMSGAGNDFVVVDNRTKLITDPENFSKSACHRHLGIGADGVLLVEQSDKADFTMKYYNADGTHGGMCGNGGRCIAKFAYDNKIVQKEKFSFSALDYIYKSIRHAPELYEIEMKNPVDIRLNIDLLVKEEKFIVHYIDTGSPHCVLFLNKNHSLKDLEEIDVIQIGKSLRYHSKFSPKGTNVNFVQLIGDNKIKIRTYERGVEDETLACGTGSIASAVLSSLLYEYISPIGVKVKSGETLEISFKKIMEDIKEVKLKGSAKNIFVGEYEF